MAPLAPAPVEVEEPTSGTSTVPDRPWVVIVWNDPINLMSYVAFVFQKLFGYSKEKANQLMMDVHLKGKAVVSSGDRGEGRDRRVPAARARVVGHHAARQVIFRNPRLVKRTRSGVELHLPDEARQLLVGLIGEMRQLLGTDDPSLRRLFPTAYQDDPERDAEYQILARSELLDRRHQSLDTMEQTVGAKQLSADQVAAWMQGVNQIRLVLGTRLDLDEDDDQFDPDDPDAGARAVYAYLGLLLDQFVDAASP